MSVTKDVIPELVEESILEKHGKKISKQGFFETMVQRDVICFQYISDPEITNIISVSRALEV